jgi:hypothetical protein
MSKVSDGGCRKLSITWAIALCSALCGDAATLSGTITVPPGGELFHDRRQRGGVCNLDRHGCVGNGGARTFAGQVVAAGRSEAQLRWE